MDFGAYMSGYITPSLLPSKPSKRWNPPADSVTPTVIYLACYTGSCLLRYECVEDKQLSTRASLPAGLFEQLLAALIRKAAASSEISSEPIMSRRYAYFKLGRYVVEMEIDKARARSLLLCSFIRSVA